MPRKMKTTGGRESEKEFAVIGLGGFGASLACRLEVMGHTVMDIDRAISRVQAIADDITSAVALDATNEAALQEIDITSFGIFIVAIGDDFEANALITASVDPNLP